MSDLNIPESGDEAFEKFLKDNIDKNMEKSILTIIYSLKEKTSYMNNFYKISLESYMKMTPDDPLKKDLGKTILKLIKQSLMAVNQFDYVLLEDDE